VFAYRHAHTHITSGWKNTSEEKSINIVVSLENLFSSILVEIYKPRKKNEYYDKELKNDREIAD